MDNDRYQRIRHIVLEALERPADRRAAWVGDACGSDEALLAEVESLLANDLSLDAMRTAAFAPAADAPALDADAGRVSAASIGPYEVVSLLGEGGMGVVYRARQHEPLKREVAIKLIRRGMDSERIAARFAMERQTLASMAHRFIARVFDAGSTADGRQYVVMELVDGPPVTTYAESANLDLAGRLALFLDICQGVRHAHQRGVIHRDLKPSNVLVCEQDGVAVPKIIDFGIAKALEAEVDGLTHAGRPIGTPAYMSPEQAGAADGPVDTRTDVYALGVLLYQLLTGRTPFTFASGTPAEIYRVHRETSPPRPSTHDTPVVSAAALRGDLDSITLKALAADPEERYPSVEALVDDLERYRAGLPVQARAGTWGYRSAKFVSRHRGAVAAAAAILITLAVSLAVVSTSLVRVRNERDRATRATAVADRATAVADRTSAFLVDMLGAANPMNRGAGSTIDLRVRDVVDDAAARLAGGAFADEPEVEARLHYALGQSYDVVGPQESACEQMRLALERARASGSGLDDRAMRYANAYARCEASAGRADAVEQQLAEFFTACAPDPAPTTACRDVWSALGNVRLAQSRLPEAETAFRRALALSAGVTADDRERIGIELNIGRMLNDQRRFADAEPIFESVIERYTRTLGADHPLTMSSVQELALLYDETERRAASLPLYERIVASRLATLGPDASDTLRSQNQLAISYMYNHRPDDGRRLFEHVVESKKRTLGPDNPSTLLSMMNLGGMLMDTGRLAEAVAVFGEASGRARTALPSGHAAIGFYLAAYADALVKASRYREAERVAKEAYDRLVAARGEGDDGAREAAAVLVQVFEATGRAADADVWRPRAKPPAPGA